MPRASRKQCKSPRGFSQIASCKAQGFIPRTSRKNKGKYIVSAKYRKSKLRKKLQRNRR